MAGGGGLINLVIGSHVDGGHVQLDVVLGRTNDRRATYYLLVPVAFRSFPPDVSSVPRARQFLRRALADWGAAEWEWSASQILTELATNAVIHAGTRYDVEITFDAPSLKICIADKSTRVPLQRRHTEDATTGRGLTMVETLAASWGVEQRSGGKTVWCVVLAGPAEDLLARFDIHNAEIADEPRTADPSRGGAARGVQARAA